MESFEIRLKYTEAAKLIEIWYVHQAIYIDNLFLGERKIPNYEEAWTRYCNKASCYCHRGGEERLEKNF